VAGGTPLAIVGYGFQANTGVTIGSVNVPPLAVSANQIFVTASAQADGVEDMAVIDPPTSASSILTGVVTYGAGPNDALSLVAGANPRTPVGGQAINPIRVQALASDGVTPVAGATVVFTSSPAADFAPGAGTPLACNGSISCSLLTDQSGQASAYVTVLTPVAMTITAQLAPASYTSPQQVQTTLLGCENCEGTALDIDLVPQNVSVAQGATVSVGLTARVLSDGTPVPGHSVNFCQLTPGQGCLAGSWSVTVITNASGYAQAALPITNMTSEVEGSVCVGPNKNPCENFYVFPVPSSGLQLQAVAGDFQAVTVGSVFQPVTVRITDTSVPPNPVLGAHVLFQSLLGRTSNDTPIISGGDTTISQNPMPIILGTSQVAVTSGANGLASVQPSTGGFTGALAILGTVTGGSGSMPFQLQSLWPITP
jgi:hypothetical protein